MSSFERNPSPAEDADVLALIELGLVERAVDADGRPGYSISAAICSPSYAPNEALAARLSSRRKEKRRDTLVGASRLRR